MTWLTRGDPGDTTFSLDWSDSNRIVNVVGPIPMGENFFKGDQAAEIKRWGNRWLEGMSYIGCDVLRNAECWEFICVWTQQYLFKNYFFPLFTDHAIMKWEQEF